MTTEPTPDPLSLPWRIGSHVGRTVYAQAGDGASKTDVLIGVMDTPELAAETCAGHNERLRRAGRRTMRGEVHDPVCGPGD